MEHNISILTEEIKRLSVNSSSWEEARKEWTVDDVYDNPSFDTCLCSHYPIREIIIMRNVHNGNLATIGNVCVNRFFGNSRYNKFFKAIINKRINEDVILISFERHLINEWEKDFMLDVYKKRRLSANQSNKRNEITKKILNRFVKD